MATNKAPKKQWVYKRLVKGDKDLVGLIAYGFYKNRKTELADNFRRSGLPEDEIDKKLADFHDQEVSGNGALDQYRLRAERFLDHVLAATHTHAKREAVDCIVAEAVREKRDKQHWLITFMLWLLSGVPGGIATVLLTLLMFGGIMMFATPHQRSQITSDVVNKTIGEEVVAPKVEQPKNTKR